MPPLPHAYQGPGAIGAFMRTAEERRGVPLRLVKTRANGQPAFGCYAPASDTDTRQAFALFVLTVERNQISAITWFADSSLLSQFGMPPSLK
jgi:RNA polymerase sigma-70 factor (ECF subfamily)